MLRCPEPVGKYKVQFQFLASDGIPREEEYIALIGFHADIMTADSQVAEAQPRASQKAPFVGELCAHEVKFLNSIPGKAYNVHWRFDFKEVK